MIVMIEEIPGAQEVKAWPADLITVRRAWVQHASEFGRLYSKAAPNEPATFMGLPLATADAKKWNELLILEGSKRVKALDWPPPQPSYNAAAESIRKEVDRSVLKSMTKYVA